jgi:hypothetical protein
MVGGFARVGVKTPYKLRCHVIRYIVGEDHNQLDSTMKSIIRDIETGRFLKRPGSFVATQSKALEFGDSFAAWEFCAAHKIYDVEIVLLFSEPFHEVPIRTFSETLAGIPLLKNLEGGGVASQPVAVGA